MKQLNKCHDDGCEICWKKKELQYKKRFEGERMTFEVRQFMGETIHPNFTEKDQSLYVLLEDHLKAMKEQKSKVRGAIERLFKGCSADYNRVLSKNDILKELGLTSEEKND